LQKNELTPIVSTCVVRPRGAQGGRAENPAAEYAKELAAFRAEAEAVRAGRSDELPANVFAAP